MNRLLLEIFISIVLLLNFCGIVNELIEYIIENINNPIEETTTTIYFE